MTGEAAELKQVLDQSYTQGTLYISKSFFSSPVLNMSCLCYILCIFVIIEYYLFFITNNR